MIPINKEGFPGIEIIVLVSFILTSGCSVRVADLTLISTKNIDLSNATLDVRKGQRTKGEDCAIALLGLIPLGIPNLEEAVDDALEKGKGNVMVDQVSYSKGAYFIIASQSCIEVEGTVLNVAETY
jgi:hypothetical protein